MALAAQLLGEDRSLWDARIAVWSTYLLSSFLFGIGSPPRSFLPENLDGGSSLRAGCGCETRRTGGCNKPPETKYTPSIENRGQLCTLGKHCCLQLFHLCTFSNLTLQFNLSTINTHPKKLKRPKLFFTEAN